MSSRFRLIVWSLLLASVAFVFLLPVFHALEHYSYFFVYCRRISDSYPEVFLLLSGSLAAGLIAEFLLPTAAIDSITRASAFIRKHSVFLMSILCALTLAALMIVNRKVLHSFLNSADEHSCYFLAECLRMGKLFVKPHELSEFFNVVHVGNKAGKWFSVYPPGWPLIWALGINFNFVDWLNPIMTTMSLGLIFLSGRKVFGAAETLIGLALTTFTPFFLFTGASYFSHATCLLMMALFLYAFLRWQEAKDEPSCALWSGIAAVACGYGLMTRYLTMAAFAFPFYLYHYLPLFMFKRRWKKSDFIAPVILFVFVILVLVQNKMITGKLFKAPNKFDKSWEKLGFRSDYTILNGLEFIVSRFFYLADWFAPGLVLLFLGGFAIKRSGENPIRRLTRYAFFYPAIAYFFYYSWGGNQYGPRYWWEGFPFLGLALTDSLRDFWQRNGDGFKKWLIGVVVASVISGGYFFYKQTIYVEEYSRQRKALYVLAEETIHSPSIVFISGFIGSRLVFGEEDAIRNSPRLNGMILYAHDLGDKNSQLMAAYPDRSYYRGTFNAETKTPLLVELKSGKVGLK